MRLKTAAATVVLMSGVRVAYAADAGKLAGSPVRIDVTETSLVNWHGDNLNATRRIDDNYAEWINRFNVIAVWRAWQLGLRLDTAKYWGEPRLGEFTEENGYTRLERRDAARQLPHRYRDTFLVEGNYVPGPRDPSVYPSKYFLSYVKPNFELTIGDAYASFGRGFVLNVRKFDEIGADTTIQGAKVVARAIGPFTLTGVLGLSNPTRVDDATGYKLADAPNRCQSEVLEPDKPLGKTYCDRVVDPWTQTWSRDAILGLRAEARIQRATIGVHGANIRRRDDLFTDDPSFVRDVTGFGANVSIPKISDALPLNLYSEIALQRRVPFPERNETTTGGYAAYTALSYTAGILTTSVEGKHYRHMNPARLNADKSRYFAFQAVQYTANPTVELITQDSLFDNSCTSGGRVRFDVKPLKTYALFASVGRFANWQQGCGAEPTLGISPVSEVTERRDITDLYVGFDLRSARDASYVTVMMGTRRENRADGSSYYREGWIQANGSKVLSGFWSLEVDAWHRNRYLNLEQWREGQTYVALKYASKYSAVLGHEYSTRPSQITPVGVTSAGDDPLRALRFLPTDDVQHFLNVGGQIKFSDAVMLRFLFGEQRAALKCVSGVCRFFPALAGARSELIVRY